MHARTENRWVALAGIAIQMRQAAAVAIANQLSFPSPCDPSSFLLRD